jgi:peroxiredoxin
MKSWIVAASAALFALASGQALAASVGEPAPNFSVLGADGKTHQLGDYAGKIVVLEWTNHECPFVVKHYAPENMQGLQKQFGEQEVVWFTVISSKPGSQGHVSAEKANELSSSRNAVPHAVLLDESGDMGRAYNARVTPHMYVIDAEGTLVYAGGIDSIPSTNSSDIARAEPHLKLAVNEVLAGEPVSNPSTRPYGCTIKY